MADNDKTPKKDDPTPETSKDTRFQKKFPKKIIPDSQPSSDTDEERMEMWKNLQQQLQMERELNRMQFEELRTALRTRHENPAPPPPPPPPPIRTEDIPPPRRHPMHGRRTFADRVAHTDFATLIRHQPVDNLSMLPHNDFVVENIKQDIIREEDNLRSLLLNIELHENSMDPDAADDHPVLTQLKNSYMDRAVQLARKRAQIQKAQTVASSYSASLEMPTYQRPPPGHIPPHDVLDPSKVIKTISVFDDETNPTKLFRHVWTKILQYGKRHFLNEQEHKDVLGAVLWGNSLEDFNRMEATGSTLKEIVDNLARIYDKTPSLDDYKSEVDNFIRKKNETITQAMARATTIIQKLRPMSSEGAWPETRDNMRKSILKQIVQSTTKRHLTYEEAKMNSSGGLCNIESLIQIAHQYEQAMGSMPEKEIVTAYQTASYAPKYTAPEMKKIQSTMEKVMKGEAESQPTKQGDKMDTLITLMTNQLDMQKKTYDKLAYSRERPKSQNPSQQGQDNRSRSQSNPRYGEQNRSYSQNRGDQQSRDNSRNRNNSQSRNNSGSNQGYNRNRTQSNVQFENRRGRSQERRGYNPNTPRSQTPSLNKDNSPRSRSQSRDRTPSNIQIPQGLKLVDGKFVYFCDPCGSFHLAHIVCNKHQQRMAEN